MNKLKLFCKKTAVLLENLIGIALAICLFLGALGFIGYMIAFIIGGDTAEAICVWIYKTFYGYLIKLSTITTVATFVLLYLKGDANWVNPIQYWRNRCSKKTCQ